MEGDVLLARHTGALALSFDETDLRDSGDGDMMGAAERTAEEVDVCSRSFSSLLAFFCFFCFFLLSAFLPFLIFPLAAFLRIWICLGVLP